MAKDKSGNTYLSEAQSNARSKRDQEVNTKDDARENRQVLHAARTDEQQLARLDTMFGKGLGAARERARLLKRIEEKKKNPQKESKESTTEKQLAS